MCQIKLKTASLVLCLLLLLSVLLGCGIRGSNTGSVSGRIIDSSGSVVVNALVYSTFKNDEKVYSGLDGGFYLGELPAGNNKLVISHPNYHTENRQIEILANAPSDTGDIMLDSLSAAHKITNISVYGVGSESVKISWKTYKPVVCAVQYGPSTLYSGIYRESRAHTEHEAVLTGLEPASLYHFRVQYSDENGISCYSHDFLFKTDEPNMPNPPQNIALQKPLEEGVINLSWQAPEVGKAQGYNVYKKTNGGDWQRLNDAPLGKKEKSFSDKNALPGTFCQYAATSLNSLSAESEKSVSETMFVPGTANSDIFITEAASPVVLYGDLTVAAGCMLSVRGPCEFLIAEKDALKSGLDEDRVEITINGTADFAGTKEAPITFGALTGTGQRAHWGGIKVCSSLTGISKFENVLLFGCKGYAIEADTDNIVINNVLITYSEGGILLKNVDSETKISLCSFDDISNTALCAENCRKIVVSSCELTNVEYAIKSESNNSNDSLSIKDSSISAKKSGIFGSFGSLKMAESLVVCDNASAVVIKNVLSPQNSYIDHCTIDSYNGVIIEKGAIAVENNIIVCSGGGGLIGIKNEAVGMPEYRYNDVYGFSELYSGCSGGEGAISVNPLFVGMKPYPYKLSNNSTLLLQDSHGQELGRYGHSRM